MQGDTLATLTAAESGEFRTDTQDDRAKEGGSGVSQVTGSPCFPWFPVYPGPPCHLAPPVQLVILWGEAMSPQRCRAPSSVPSHHPFHIRSCHSVKVTDVPRHRRCPLGTESPWAEPWCSKAHPSRAGTARDLASGDQHVAPGLGCAPTQARGWPALSQPPILSHADIRGTWQKRLRPRRLDIEMRRCLLYCRWSCHSSPRQPSKSVTSRR